MQYLRQSTASQSVLIGPFVDDTDGKTAETGLTIANTDIRLSANGGNMFAKTSGGGTHDEAGWYTITLDATDSATVGRLQLSVHVSGALPVYAQFQVLEEAIFDAMFAASATGLLPANVTQISGDATAAIQLSLSAGVIISGTVSTAVLSPTTSAFASDDITEATPDHYLGRSLIFTSGALLGQGTRITGYSLVSAEGNFAVVALTEAPANNDTFIIV